MDTLKKFKGLIIVGIIVIAVIGIIGWFVSIRNSFVTLDEEVAGQWAKVETQYQRRLDLIPNLVETVKGYAEHESTTLESVTAARTGLSDAYNNATAQTGSVPATEEALNAYNSNQQALGKALNIYVNAVKEAYPDLKANEQFLGLQAQLEGTENRIATERGRYTELVKSYNVAVRRFPGSIVASIGGFSVKPQFKADEAAATAPKISF